MNALDKVVTDFKEAILAIMNKGYIVNDVGIQVYYSMWIWIYQEQYTTEEEQAMRSIQTRMLQYGPEVMNTFYKMVSDNIVLCDDYEFNRFIRAFNTRTEVVDLNQYTQDIFNMIENARLESSQVNLPSARSFDDNYNTYRSLITRYLAAVTGVSAEEDIRYAGRDFIISCN